MALRFSAPASNSTYTAARGGITALGPPLTMVCWGSLSLDRNTFSDLIAIYKNGQASAPFYGFYLGADSDGTTMRLWNGAAGTTGVPAAGRAMTVGSWYRFAVVLTSTTAGTYYHGDTTLTSTMTTGAVSGLTGTNVYRSDSDILSVSGVGAAGLNLNGRVAAVKLYNAALTSDEVHAETLRYRPVRTVNLRNWLPIIERGSTRNVANDADIYAVDQAAGQAAIGVTDGSGWTGATFEDGPPIPW